MGTGFDIGKTSVHDAASCCDACKSRSTCSFWSFKNGTCMLKNSDAGRKKSVGTVSGSATAPPPPGTGTRISAFATRDGNGSKPVSCFLSYWSTKKDDKTRIVRVSVDGPLPQKAIMRRIAPQHADILTPWKQMGSPPHPTPAQIDELMKASEVIAEDATIASDGSVTVSLSPNTAVVLSYPHLTELGNPESAIDLAI